MFGRKDNREAQFATCKDFQKIFTEEMGSLHLLALMLTADEYKAQHCFVAGLEDSIQGNPVFQQWARSWSKRAIIKNAIKLVAPAPELPGGELPEPLHGRDDRGGDRDAACDGRATDPCGRDREQGA